MFDRFLLLAPKRFGKVEIKFSLKSDGGDKALRTSTIPALVNVMHEARRMWLDARKVHLGAAFHAIYVSVQPLGLALTVWHFSIIKLAACRMISYPKKCGNQLEIVVLPRRSKG